MTPKLSALTAFRKGELEDLLFKEEVHWRQKARIMWVKEWDCNSKYFHRVPNVRINRKFFKSSVNEKWATLVTLKAYQRR